MFRDVQKFQNLIFQVQKKHFSGKKYVVYLQFKKSVKFFRFIKVVKRQKNENH